MATSSGCSDHNGCNGGSEEKSLMSWKSIFGDGRDKEAQAKSTVSYFKLLQQLSCVT